MPVVNEFQSKYINPLMYINVNSLADIDLKRKEADAFTYQISR